MISFAGVPTSPYVGRLNSRLLEEVQDVRSVEVARNAEVGYTLLNRHRIGEAAAVVAVGSFMSDLTMPDRAYEGIQLASLDRPVLMLDLPGHGYSTSDSPKQIFELCIKRNADGQAAPLIDAVLQLLHPDDALDYFGISHGGLISVKSAEGDPGDRVGTVFAIDLPAVKPRLTLGLQFGYMVKDGMLGRKQYLEALNGTRLEEDFEQFKKAFDQGAPEAAKKFYANNPGLFFLNLFASINARPVALKSWQTVMENKSANISVVTAEKSSVSNAEAIDEFIKYLPPEYRSRSSQTVIHGEDHNIGIVHLMPRAVQWAKVSYGSKG